MPDFGLDNSDLHPSDPDYRHRLELRDHGPERQVNFIQVAIASFVGLSGGGELGKFRENMAQMAGWA